MIINEGSTSSDLTSTPANSKLTEYGGGGMRREGGRLARAIPRILLKKTLVFSDLNVIKEL